MSRETKPKDKRKATSIQRLEEVIESLMLEVAATHPGAHCGTDETLGQWARLTAQYVVECVKRKDSDVQTIKKRATRAVRRRLERELANSYMDMEVPNVTTGSDDEEG